MTKHTLTSEQFDYIEDSIDYEYERIIPDYTPNRSSEQCLALVVKAGDEVVPPVRQLVEAVAYHLCRPERYENYVVPSLEVSLTASRIRVEADATVTETTYYLPDVSVDSLSSMS